MCNDHATALPRPVLTLALLPALLCALLLAGCGGGGSNGGGSSSPSPTPTPPAAPLSVSAVTPSGLMATLAESAAAIAVGGSVTYTLTNGTSLPVTFQPQFNKTGGSVVVSDASGTAVYPVVPTGVSSTAVPGPGPSITLAAGQSVSDAVTVAGIFSASGNYSATAVFSAIQVPATTIQATTVGPLTVTVQQRRGPKDNHAWQLQPSLASIFASP